MTNVAYEFTPEQNRTLSSLAGRMRAVGGLLIVVAILVAAEAVLLVWKGMGSAVGFEVGAILLLIGFWSVRAAAEFGRVVNTQGADVSHLMDALREIKKLYDVQFWAFVALAILVSLAMLSVAVGPGRLTGPYP